jgi:hypothetical protein
MSATKISIGNYIVRRLEEQGVEVRSRMFLKFVTLTLCSLCSGSLDRILPSSWYVDSRSDVSCELKEQSHVAQDIVEKSKITWVGEW